MAAKKDESAETLRTNTDKSLGEERLKTDEYLEQKSQAVTEDAEEAIRSHRLAADNKKEQARAEADQSKSDRRQQSAPTQASKTDDKILTQEREQSDKAQALEREREDKVRIRERFQKRLIAEALLDGERKETDANLLDERAGIDLDSRKSSTLLDEEKHSHGAAKAALVTRDQFLAVVSHDLRNPLGSIALSAGLMRRELAKGNADQEKLLRWVGIIEKSSGNMDRLINDLLDIERMDNEKLEIRRSTGDICQLLAECKELFAPVASSKNFEMLVESCSDSLIAEFDHDRMLQVLSNLIGNALKFTPKGGKIGLSAKKVKVELEISVSDNGPGIPQEKLLKIFDRFSQLGTDDRRGLGLGLFISKWIVEAHGGRIWVISEPKKGSTFSFTLPVS